MNGSQYSQKMKDKVNMSVFLIGALGFLIAYAVAFTVSIPTMTCFYRKPNKYIQCLGNVTQCQDSWGFPKTEQSAWPFWLIFAAWVF